MFKFKQSPTRTPGLSKRNEKPFWPDLMTAQTAKNKTVKLSVSNKDARFYPQGILPIYLR